MPERQRYSDFWVTPTRKAELPLARMVPNAFGVRNVPEGVEVYIDNGACWCEPSEQCPWCALGVRHRHLVDEVGEVTMTVQTLS